MKDILEGWKTKVLSRARRVTLVKSVLNSIPMFYMQLEKFPANVHKEIDKMVRRCVWGEMGDRRRLHPISWDSFCKPKELGSVGLRKSAWMNQDLVAKLSWIVLNQDDVLWVRVVKGKYYIGEDGSWQFINKNRESKT